ncbi:hypothetical protein SASPL_156262 [Salvia splendens]|uniref:Transcription initiation factor TFIID subunit 8 n=1 Tax=Salvia splendens TaxID=180675 RepID=A0A8X8VX55_SALSN|nr:hypothetical protein SASPL_156262 [Salvia splendens]
MAQICEGVGFEGFNESALDSLVDIAIRTGCNVFDVVQGLEDLGKPQGFTGASEVHTDCVVSSGAIREIKEERRMIPSFLQMGETPAFKHVPQWLPAFPDAHTYVRTPVWNERLSDPRTDKIELARQHRKAERSLLNLQQRLVCNGSSVATSSAEPCNGGNGSGVNNNGNLSLEKPLEAEDIGVSRTFAPAIEAMKDGLDSGSDGEKTFPEKRDSVVLELKGVKSLVALVLEELQLERYECKRNAATPPELPRLATATATGTIGVVVYEYKSQDTCLFCLHQMHWCCRNKSEGWPWEPKWYVVRRRRQTCRCGALKIMSFDIKNK